MIGCDALCSSYSIAYVLKEDFYSSEVKTISHSSETQSMIALIFNNFNPGTDKKKIENTEIIEISLGNSFLRQSIH